MLHIKNQIDIDPLLKLADFQVQIPSDLDSKCDTAGKCAIQWWWYAFNVQTYESCVDLLRHQLDREVDVMNCNTHILCFQTHV